MRSPKPALFLTMVAAGACVPLAAKAAPPAQIAPTPPPGKGEIVFFRHGSVLDGPVSCAVHENDAKVSSLPIGHYFVLAAEPGKHRYAVESEARDTINLQVESGEVQYVSCHIKMGVVVGRPVLVPATEAQFTAKKLKEVEPAKVTAAPAPPPS